jgi:hypothetical protein
VQPRGLPQLVGFLYIRIPDDNLGAGCFDRVVISTEQDYSFAADLDLRACHASPPMQEISATERRFGGAFACHCGSDPQPILITYNNDYT